MLRNDIQNNTPSTQERKRNAERYDNTVKKKKKKKQKNNASRDMNPMRGNNCTEY